MRLKIFYLLILLCTFAYAVVNEDVIRMAQAKDAIRLIEQAQEQIEQAQAKRRLSTDDEIYHIILKGANHDNTVFGITLGKTTFEEVTRNSIFKDCSFKQTINGEGFDNAPWKTYVSENTVMHILKI